MENKSKKHGVRRFIKLAAQHISGADLINSSVLISYYILLAMFPAAIVVGNVLTLMGFDPVSAMEYLSLIIPGEVSSFLEPILVSLVTQGSGGLLSIGAIVTLWSTSRSINRMQRGINNVYGVKSNASPLGKKLFSMLFLLLLMLIVVAFIVVLSFGFTILEYLASVFPSIQSFVATLQSLKWPVTITFVFISLLLVYAIAPAAKVGIKQALPGTIFATAGLILLAQAFAIYLQFMFKSLSSYGALSTFFVMMFWLNFSAMILLLGAVINATISEFKYGPGEAKDYVSEKLIAKPQSLIEAKMKNGIANSEKKKEAKESEKEKKRKEKIKQKQQAKEKTKTAQAVKAPSKSENEADIAEHAAQ